MARRETFILRGLPLAAAALALAWLARSGAGGAAVVAALAVLPLVLVLLLLPSLLAAGPWALVDLAIPGLLFGAAGGVLLGTPHRTLAALHLGVGAVGLLALAGGLLVARAQDRARRERDALVEARREIGRLHRRLWLETKPVSDDEVRDAVDALARRLDGDVADRAAELMGAVAPLAHARPHLADALLAAPLALLRRAGVDRGAAVVAWAHAELDAGTRLETDARGRRWLTDALPAMEARLDALLAGEGTAGPAAGARAG